MSELTIQHLDQPERGRFFVMSGDERTAEMDYTRAGQVITITHTWVSDTLRGQGVARKLLDRAVGFARDQHLKVIPVCSYAKGQFEKDPSIGDVLAR